MEAGNTIPMEHSLNTLQPNSVWRHFSALCRIPRPSYHEHALRDYLIQWATEKNIDHRVDSAGNLILSKPGSRGYEVGAGVILQGHLDMVCQANKDTLHDFLRDAIPAVLRDGWVISEKTTLGADNGIGVALALAALEEDGLIHPPLEVLLTVNEECGMDGARGLSPGCLQGSMLINLDTEEWGHFYLGCAGGVDVVTENTLELEDVPPGYVMMRFEVSGLKGGHSGIDIHRGRGNAIRLLAEAIQDLSAHTDIRLISLHGGTARNAIPREAQAVCALRADAVTQLDPWVVHRLDSWKKRFAEADPAVMFKCRMEEKHDGKSVSASGRDSVLAYLSNCVNGVINMSSDFPGVTETSSNLGVALLDKNHFSSTIKVRSLRDAEAVELADKLVSCAGQYRLKGRKEGAYPGWTPNPGSRLLKVCQQVYVEQYGEPAGIQVIHAGLECGLLAASHPHLDMISFGPDISGAHAPGEKVEVASVGRCWELLKVVLKSLAESQACA